VHPELALEVGGDGFTDARTASPEVDRRQPLAVRIARVREQLARLRRVVGRPPGMPGGTMLCAGTWPPKAPRVVIRAQSTAAPSACRTRGSSNGAFVVSIPR